MTRTRARELITEPSPGLSLPTYRALSHQAAPPPYPGYDIVRRALDIAIASALLVASLPLLAVAALAILLTLRANPLLRQVRTGHLGREFVMLKLRTMRPPDNSYLQGEAVLVAKAPTEVHLSALGRLLRRTSIDELPQLWNVLRGDMTLVGPRPGLPVEVARYPISWRRRLTVRPGLTGLWQVSGRACVEERRRTAMDRAYLRLRTNAFDCVILLRTAAAVVSMRGAW